MVVSKKHIDHCKWIPEIMMVLLKCMTPRAPLKQKYVLNTNICQLHGIDIVNGYQCSSKINTVPTEKWMAAATFMK